MTEPTTPEDLRQIIATMHRQLEANPHLTSETIAETLAPRQAPYQQEAICYKRTLTTLGLIICITLLLTTCGSGSTHSPDIHLEEDGSELQFTEEVIRLTNCGNPASTEQTKTRFFSVTADRVTGLQLDCYVVEGNIQARYQQYASITTSQKLIAAPNTDMDFVLRWSEEVHQGTFAVGDKTGFYSVNILSLPPFVV